MRPWRCDEPNAFCTTLTRLPASYHRLRRQALSRRLDFEHESRKNPRISALVRKAPLGSSFHPSRQAVVGAEGRAGRHGLQRARTCDTQVRSPKREAVQDAHVGGVGPCSRHT
jgi:hypothetical protein